MAGLGIGFLVVVLGGLVLLAGAVLAFWVWMLVDAAKVPADHLYQSGSKVMWVVLIVLLGAPGALVYLLAGRPTRATREWLAANPGAALTGPPPPWTGAAAPPPGSWEPEDPWPPDRGWPPG